MIYFTFKRDGTVQKIAGKKMRFREYVSTYARVKIANAFGLGDINSVIGIPFMVSTKKHKGAAKFQISFAPGENRLDLCNFGVRTFLRLHRKTVTPKNLYISVVK